MYGWPTYSLVIALDMCQCYHEPTVWQFFCIVVSTCKPLFDMVVGLPISQSTCSTLYFSCEYYHAFEKVAAVRAW